MERLKSTIPVRLRTRILSTPTADLTVSCAALVQHFSTVPDFSQLLEQLVSPDLTSCAKDAARADKWKRDGNAAFGSRNYNRALSCYNEKLCFLESAIRDCDRAMELHLSYSKAWYRRGRVKCDLSDFAGAIRDMEKALASETTSGGQLHIERELAQMKSNLKSAHGSGHTQICSSSLDSAKKRTGASSQGMELQNIQGMMSHVRKCWTKEKGWSLHAKDDLPSGSLIFQEDPYAAVILKTCRDSHCHFCFELLPADPVPCSGCAIPRYCSLLCRSRASGNLPVLQTQSILVNSKQNDTSLIPGGPPANTSTQLFQSGTCQLDMQKAPERSYQRWGEHMPECGGASWSAVLPTEAVLGVRMLFAPTKMDNGVLTRDINLVKGTGDLSDVDTLCHHYDHLSPNDKLELHVLGIVIAHCLKQSASPLLGRDTKVAAIASKLIGLIAQARVNAMAIFGMSSPEFSEDVGDSSCSISRSGVEHSLCTVEQVKVARGIFMIGSRLNHSCIPNVHASFVLDRLFIRAVTTITLGSTLELCYGPQVGEWNQLERKQQLLENYFFNCTCPACSKLTLPDLFLRSFRCVKPACMGIVLGTESLASKFSGMGYSNPVACIGSREEESSGVEGYFVSKEKKSQQVTKCSTAAVDASVIDEEFLKAIHIREEDNTGCCLCCGVIVDIKRAHEVATRATFHLERVEADLVKSDGNNLRGALKDALQALNSLRMTVHAYNEQLAKAEDIVARLLCALDQPLQALKHCQKSIEILEHLYSKEHIVIGNEHVKLASVALLVHDMECARQSLALVDQIFTVHYGSDYRTRLSYVVRLQQMAQ